MAPLQGCSQCRSPAWRGLQVGREGHRHTRTSRDGTGKALGRDFGDRRQTSISREMTEARLPNSRILSPCLCHPSPYRERPLCGSSSKYRRCCHHGAALLESLSAPERMSGQLFWIHFIPLPRSTTGGRSTGKCVHMRSGPVDVSSKCCKSTAASTTSSA